MLTTVVLISVLAQPTSTSLVFGGDVIPHAPVKSAAKQHAKRARVDGKLEDVAHDGWDHVFGPLAPVFRQFDCAVVNLETPLTERARPATGEKVFNAPAMLPKALKSAGVTVATFANNHCLDQGREGIASTRALLEGAGVLTAGAGLDEASAWAPLVVDAGGLRVAIIAFSRWLNGHDNARKPTLPHVPVVPYARSPIVGGRAPADVVALVKTWREKVDVVVVTAHWGDEYSTAPRDDDRALAGALIEAGAAAVIGHHPHVLQPVEWVPRGDGSYGVVAFSLGNLVSNQDMTAPDGPSRDGLLLGLTLERDFRSGRVEVRRLTPVSVWTENRMGADGRRDVQPLVLADELSAMEERLVLLATRDDAKSRRERKLLTQRQRRAAEHRARIEAVMPSSESPPTPALACTR